MSDGNVHAARCATCRHVERTPLTGDLICAETTGGRAYVDVTADHTCPKWDILDESEEGHD